VTIGIAAYGPNAGLAIFLSLRAVERVGAGSIGGFAVFAAIAADGRLMRHETQRGGASTLFIEGETTGADPPPEVAAASFAAVISSGPDRPEAHKFLCADARAGLVTGHRMSTTIGVDGIAVNQQVLDLMKTGKPPEVAIDTVLDRNPEADAGLIALDRTGLIYARNSARVLRRPDLSETCDSRNGTSVAVLYNSIRPHKVLAGLAAEIAFETMLGIPKSDGQITMNAGVRLIGGKEAAIYCDANDVVTHIATSEVDFRTGRRNWATVDLGAPVYRDGMLIGRAISDTIATFLDGKIASIGGKKSLSLGYRRIID
jgi:hypothetical protein